MPIYSHSRLSTFENCPLQYKFKYIDRVKLEEEWESIEAFMGSRVHDVLEKLYRDLKVTKLNSLEELLSFYDGIWEKNWNEDIKVIKKGYTPENYKDTGRKCITNYYNRHAPFDESTTLSLEQRVTIDIDGRKLMGYIDRVSCTDGGNYEIHDYKTGQYLPVKKHFDSDRQLALYQIGVENMWEDAKKVDLVWHYLAHDKEIRSRRTKKQISKLKTDVVSLIEEMERAKEEGDFPSCESGLCSWCEYRELCPNFGHISKMRDTTLNEFLKESGVELVNRYAKLVHEKTLYLEKIESEIAKLRDALISYSKKEGFEVIIGSDRKLKVKSEMKTRFPAKSDPRRAKLDALIKKEDKWGDVSDLNTHSLAKALKSKSWDKKLVKKIKKYQSLEENYRLTLSALKDEEE